MSVRIRRLRIQKQKEKKEAAQAPKRAAPSKHIKAQPTKAKNLVDVRAPAEKPAPKKPRKLATAQAEKKSKEE